MHFDNHIMNKNLAYFQLNKAHVFLSSIIMMDVTIPIKDHVHTNF